MLLTISAGPSENPFHGAPDKVISQSLPNALCIHPKVISGGQPDGDKGFEALKALGVKTIISVDGARPDVATAKKYGLRYVHLPHGYDGIPRERQKELAKALRDLDGPIYIHCHHGKHRSPAAAVVACVGAGFIKPDRAISILELAGTSKSYRGLYQSAQSSRPLEKAMLDELAVEFHESVELPPLAEVMVALEKTHDHLKEIRSAGWRAPAEQPDLDPAHEALLLREHFTELLRADHVQGQSGPFIDILRDSERASGELEVGLRRFAPGNDPTRLDHAFARLTNNCNSCHRQFRDLPLSER